MSSAIDNQGTFAEVVEGLGGVPLTRIMSHPHPGTATEKDVIACAEAPRKHLCELIDGTLVEKPMGYLESILAMGLGRLLGNFVAERKLGLVSGEAGLIRLRPGRVRIPDLAFIAWDRLPEGRVPGQPIPDLAPSLAVEILSPSNTVAEMAAKRADYFSVGAQLVWEVDPDLKTIAVYTAADRVVTLGMNDTLDGGHVLPGFTLRISELFGSLTKL